MEILVVYYSRTGTTRKVAEEISKGLNAHIEEIIDLKDRRGPVGYVMGGKDAMKKDLTRIRPIDNKPSKYDLVIIGTPVWAWTVSPAIRSFIVQNKAYLKDKKLALFCTMGSNGDDTAFKEMEELLETKNLQHLSLLTRQVMKEPEFATAAIKKFLEKITV